MSDTYTGYLVIHMPEGQETVNHMRVIDSWASTGDLSEARKTAKHNAAQYREDHGPGYIYVVVAEEREFI